MINILPNIQTNVISPVKVHPSFKGRIDKGGDEFVKTTYNPEDSKMSEQRYSQVDSAFDAESVLKSYRKKIRIMPLIMDRLMYSVANYVSGNKSSKDFAKNFSEDTITLSRRIELGKDGKEYAQTYIPELTLITGINPLCSDFKNGLIDQTEMDAGIEKFMQEYVEDNTVRAKNFLK